MKKDFFESFNTNHGLNCSTIYSQLFKNVKFVPNSYYVVDEKVDDKGNKKGYIFAKTKYSKEKNAFIDLYISVFTQNNSDYFIHDIFFIYKDVYYAISNVIINSEGITFDYNCYKTDSYKIVCEEKNKVLPRHDDFNNIKPTLSDHGCLSIYGKFDNLGFYKDIISFIVGSYEFDQRIPSAPTRSRNSKK